MPLSVYPRNTADFCAAENRNPNISSKIEQAFQTARDQKELSIGQAFDWALSCIQENEEQLRKLSVQDGKWRTLCNTEIPHPLEYCMTEQGMEFLIYLDEIGKGSFREVTKKIWVKESGESSIVAEARPISKEGTAELIAKMLKEAALFSSLYGELKKPACALFIDSEGAVQPRLLSPCLAQSLTSYMEEKFPMSQDEVTRIGKTLASALARLHRNGYCYRDIKPDNVCLDDGGRAYFIDLNPAPRIGEVSERGDGAYEAPEIDRNKESCIATTSADIWSLGMLFLEMRDRALYNRLQGAVSKRIFQGDESRYNSILKDLQTSSERLDTIIAQMLDWAPDKRPEAYFVAEVQA